MYFNPGTGSLIIQIAIFLIAGTLAFLFIQRKKIIEYFKNKKNNK